MKNFSRVLRLCLHYRWTVAATLGSALAVALLWGGNIGAVVPVVEVVLKGRSVQQWIDSEIATSRQAAEEHRQSVQRLEAELASAPAADQPGLQRQIQYFELRRAAELKALAWREWIRPWIYAHLPEGSFPTLLVIVGVLLSGTIIKSVFLVLNTIWEERLTQLGLLELRNHFYRRTLRMDLASFNEQGTHDLMSRFTYDMNQLANGVSVLLGKAIREPLKMLACLVGAGLICWRLLVLSLIVAPLAGYLINRLARSIRRANRRAMEEMSQIYNSLSETFSGIKAIKAFTRERRERLRFRRSSKQFFRKAMRIAGYDALIRPVTEVMGISTMALAILAGGYLVLNRQTQLLGITMCDRPLTVESLVLFFGLLIGASDPARRMSDVFGHVQRAAAAADRIYQMIDREPTIADPPRPVPAARHRRSITLEEVRFAYAEGDDVLHGIHLEIPFGQTLAIVGANGSGKSTLANLLPRFYDPTAGRVKIDGVDIRAMRLRDLRGQIGIVTQETLLFNDTVLNNIHYGNPAASREQVLEAARQAHADRFIETQLDEGYETIVGPQGSRLSGGQRQRISLARAILRDPAILILDEATSQVDPESELLIHRVLAEFVRNRTTIVVSHRRSTLDLADRILVMEAGWVVGDGTQDQLVRDSEVFNRLFDCREIA